MLKIAAMQALIGFALGNVQSPEAPSFFCKSIGREGPVEAKLLVFAPAYLGENQSVFLLTTLRNISPEPIQITLTGPSGTNIITATDMFGRERWNKYYGLDAEHMGRYLNLRPGQVSHFPFRWNMRDNMNKLVEPGEYLITSWFWHAESVPTVACRIRLNLQD